MKLTFLITFSVIFFSCGKTNVIEKPKDLLSKESMSTILANLAIAEAAYNYSPTPEQLKSDTVVKFNVFKQSNINRIQFQSSLDYYSRFPNEMKEIYEKSLTIVSEKRN